MKTRLLISIGISVVITISLLSYAIYDSSTTVFISCDPQYEQIDDKCVLKISETDYEELECLRLYKDIREISRTDGFALAERETIDMHKSLVFEYVEKNCPDFPDLEFIYNNYKQNIPEPELIPKDDVKSTQEHYEIEITGLKDVYLVGEKYDFSYIISGYGHPCGSKAVTFPDSNGAPITSASSASCIANLQMGIFVFDIQKEQGTTYGHIGIKNPGTYTVTVTFDKPSKYFPTTVSKEFRVVE